MSQNLLRGCGSNADLPTITVIGDSETYSSVSGTWLFRYRPRPPKAVSVGACGQERQCRQASPSRRVAQDLAKPQVHLLSSFFIRKKETPLLSINVRSAKDYRVLELLLICDFGHLPSPGLSAFPTSVQKMDHSARTANRRFHRGLCDWPTSARFVGFVLCFEARCLPAKPSPW
jgi:hypothetical protein